MPPLEEVKKEFKGLSSEELNEIENVLKDEVQNDKIPKDEATNEVKESEEQKEALTTEEIQEIEKIIDESIDKIQEQEDVLQCPLLNVSEETIKEYEEMEQMKPEQATNNEILKQALLNRSKSQDIESCLVYFKAKENEHFVETMKELHYIKKHMDKFALISLGLVFACGYIFGTQHEHLSPYIGKLFDLINIFKGNGGQ